MYFCSDRKKSKNTDKSLKKENWSWRNQASWLKIILQSYSHQDSMVLEKKKTTEIQTNETR